MVCGALGNVVITGSQAGRLCSLRIDGVVGGEDLVEEVVLVFFPAFGGEDFDFAEAGEVVVLHDPLVDFGEVGTAFAHDAAVEEHVGGLGLVVANVVGT